jgi:hypothetical protein
LIEDFLARATKPAHAIHDQESGRHLTLLFDQLLEEAYASETLFGPATGEFQYFGRS